MANIDNVVNISINNGTQAVTQAQFGTTLLIAKSCFMTDKVMTFTKVDDVRAMYLTTDQNLNTSDLGKKFDEDLFKTINGYFSSDPRPQKIILARRDSYYGCSPTLAANTIYSATVQWYLGNNLQSSNISFTSGASVPLLTDIITGLNASIKTSSASNIVNITGISGTALAPVGLQFNKNSNSTISYFNISALSDSLKSQPQLISNQSSVAAYSDALLTTGDFFGVGIYGTLNGNDELSSGDVLQVFDAIEASQRMSIYATDDPGNLLQSSSTDLMSLVKQKGYKYCATIQKDPNDSSQAMAVSWLANLLSREPGSANFAYKNLPGVQVTNLTNTQSAAVFLKNGNTYETMGGINITRYGNSASGQDLDVTLGFAFLKARLSEAWFSTLVNVPKIPFTDDGLAFIENPIRAIMAIAVKQKIVSTWNIIMPKSVDIPSNDKANGVLNNVVINCVIQGSVQKINAVFNFTL